MAEKKIATGYIGNALRSSAADHTTTFTDEVFDTERQKYQSEVNTNIESKIEAEAEARDLAINAETQARTQNDQLLSQAIAAEQERAEAAEEANASAIDAAVTKNEEQDQKLSKLESETSNKIGFVKTETKTAHPSKVEKYLDANIKSGETFKVLLTGTDTWTGLGICDQTGWRVNNNTHKPLNANQEYEFTADGDITEIYVYLYEPAEYSGSITIKVSTVGALGQGIESLKETVKDNIEDTNELIGKLNAVFSNITVNLLNENDEDFVIGEFLIDNVRGTSDEYFTTGYIPVYEGITYNVSSIVNDTRRLSTIRYANFYNKNKEYVSGQNTNESGILLIPNDIAFVRLTLFTNQLEKCMVLQGDAFYQYVPYASHIIKYGNVTPFVALRSPRTTISSNNIYELPKDYGRKGINVVAEVDITSGWTADRSVFIGCGYEDYQGWYAEITPTTIEFFQNDPDRQSIRGKVEHGLTLGRTFKFSIHAKNNYKALYILESDGNIYTKEDYWHGGGCPFVYNNGSTVIYCHLSSFNSDSGKDIYVYGDSYLSYTGERRWPYYVIREWNFTNFYMSHKPGINSEESWSILINNLAIGNPKFLLWLLGMNDGGDADANTPSESWLTHIQKVIALCEERKITPILATIPTCLINNEAKNSWVRNSGYRYIDFAKAVGANGDGTWYEGMLYSDRVHPTDKGARALAMQVLLDFPEITKR